MGKSIRKVKGERVNEHDLPQQTPAERATRQAFVVTSRNNDKAALRRQAGVR